MRNEVILREVVAANNRGGFYREELTLVSSDSDNPAFPQGKIAHRKAVKRQLPIFAAPVGATRNTGVIMGRHSWTATATLASTGRKGKRLRELQLDDNRSTNVAKLIESKQT